MTIVGDLFGFRLLIFFCVIFVDFLIISLSLLLSLATDYKAAHDFEYTAINRYFILQMMGDCTLKLFVFY